MRLSTCFLVVCALTGCWGRGIPYEGGEVDTDTAVTTTTCGDDVDRSSGFTVEGTTYDLETGGTAAAGLCVRAVDPGPAVSGGEPTVLATGEVCDDGSFIVAGIQEPPTIGMFILIDDCEGAAGDTVMLTGTGIKGDQVAGLGDGDSLTGVEAMVASHAFVAAQQADLALVGWSGDLETAGYMAGIVEDADGEPVSGAKVCETCTGISVYYEDAVADDGVFGADATANTETDAAADGAFMIPDAPIYTYPCSDGGAHTWDSTLLGSLDGYAVYIRFTAH